MREWRGVIIQLSSLAAVVAIVGMSKIADPHIVSMALGIVGAGVGQSIARARLDAGSSGKPGAGSGGSGGGTSLPPSGLVTVMGGVLGFLLAFGVASWAMGLT